MLTTTAADYRDLTRQELVLIDEIDRHKRTIKLEATRIQWLTDQLQSIYDAQELLRRNGESDANPNRKA